MSNGYRLYASLTSSLSPRVWAEIDTDALTDNYIKLSAMVPAGARPVCVVKADAYGHSAEICVPALINAGCSFFAVSSAEEALEIRAICDRCGCDAGVLILGYSLPANVPELIKSNIIQACFSLEYAKELSAAAGDGRLKVHIKLDTGMNRIGFPTHTPEDVRSSIDQIAGTAALPGIEIDGIFSHFATADELSDAGKAKTELQLSRFEETVSMLAARGIEPRVRHICNTAGTARFGALGFDACRLGIGLYGMDPSGEVPLGLTPVIKLKAKVAQVHLLRKGESVSYGGKFTAESDMTIATLPIGYADGFIRAYTGASVSVYSADGGKKCGARIIGRICMDQCMIDVTNAGVQPGDVAVLMGEPGQVDALARLAGTINYEVTCILSSRVERIPAGSPNNQ